MPEWAADWEVGIRVWLERAGETILGEGRSDLLAAIARTHSITAAAKAVGMSYRRAWSHVQEINQAAGEPLVTAVAGGPAGGGAKLTPRGKLSLEVFEQLRDQVRPVAAGVLQRVVAPAEDAVGVIHLAAAISLEEAIGQILTEYALVHPKIRVRAIFGASNELADHVLAGAPCDLFVSADPLHLERLATAGRIDPTGPRVVAANSLAAIGPQNIETVVSTPRDFLAPEIKQVVLADPASPLGKCARGYLEQQGLYESLLPKVVAVDNSRGVLAAIRSGRADAGLAFASDAARAVDCRVLFEIDPVEAGLAYSAAVCSAERQQDSQRLLEFFQSSAAERCFRRCGLTLPERKRK